MTSAGEADCSDGTCKRLEILRQIDDDRPFGADQHIEFRQIAVNHAGAQHQHHFLHQRRMIEARFFFGEFDVVHARRGLPRGVGHQFHQQHALVKIVGLGHTHAGAGQDHRIAGDVVIAPVGALGHRQSAELAAEHHERVFEQPALLQVVDQGRSRLVGLLALLADSVGQSTVLVPTLVIQLDEANPSLRQSTCQQAID